MELEHGAVAKAKRPGHISSTSIGAEKTETRVPILTVSRDVKETCQEAPRHHETKKDDIKSEECTPF